MGPRLRFNRFVSFILLTVLAVLCVYQSTQSHNELHVASPARDSVPNDVSVSFRGDLIKELHRHTASKRMPAKTVDDAVKKGKGLWCQLIDADPDAKLHTKFTDLNLLHKYFTEEPYEPDSDKLTDTGRSLKVALSDLNLPTIVGDRGLKGFLYTQDQFFSQGGTQRGPTGGYYIGTMSTEAGYISAENNRSPLYESGGQYSPELSALSDIYFLAWKEMASKKNNDIKNIRYFIRHHIENEHSKNIALKVFDEKIPEWPDRRVLDIENEDKGKAILGTPNGAGVAFFLMQHKPELGVRIPKQVDVFKTIGPDEDGQPSDWIHFIFHIAPYSGKKNRKSRNKGKNGDGNGNNQSE